MGDPPFVEQVDPEEVFTALSDETRVGILQALWDADGAEATFSELREAVGMRDSGQFNYHLDRLVGRFVTRTADGYELTQAGKQINGAIEAGAYTMKATIEPIPLADPCPTCDGARTLHYEDETVRVECESCPVTNQFAVPPGVFAGYDREAIPEVASRYLRTMFHHITNGFCSFCDGRVRPTVRPLRDIADSAAEVPAEIADLGQDVPLIRYDCQRCGATPKSGLYLALLQHPAVVGFYYDHGIDIQERSVWEFAALHTDRERIRGRDPLRASATYEIDGDALTVVVDEDLDVVDIEA